jgi:DNA-binding MltR family transcriptional regulator
MSKQVLSDSFGFISAHRTVEETSWQCRFIREVESETVRGAVLNITSFIDELLIRLLQSFFPNESKAKTLLSSLDSCMSTLMHRANVAHALALIRDNEFEAIKVVAKIRNEFAHKWDASSFESDEISKLVQKIPKQYFEGLDGTNKAKFMFICSQLIQELLDRHLYASHLRKRLPEVYLDMFDLPLEERQRLLRS